MDKDGLFLTGKVEDMDPNMTERLQQQTVVLDEGPHASTSFSRVSPPKAVIDSSPLQSAMDKNKESLKVKLLVRRSFDQLVEQGIMPPLKTSPAIYEQRRQLERAKTGDLLKAKIKKRPDRVELEQRHILEQCDSNVDPSLAEKRRMLEKALLVDHLNSKISHRPGPLDLIGKNILHVEEPIERMVKEGLVDYASTLDESNVSVATPVTVGEGEDSLSSEGESLHSVAIALVNQPLAQPGAPGALVQHQIQLQPPVLTTQSEFFTLKPAIPIVANDGTVLATIATPVVTTAATLATIATVNVAEFPMDQDAGSASTSTLRPLLPTPGATVSGDLATARPNLAMTPLPADLKPSGPFQSGGGGGKEKLSKKKSKSKSISKAKPIKFHEYKGPPNAHRTGSSSSASAGPTGGASGPSNDSNYQVIMQQQYLLEYLAEMCKKPAGVPSPSGARDQSSANEGDEISGSDQTPLDSPLGAGTGVGSGGGPSVGTARSKASSGAGLTAAIADLATETLNKLKVSQLKKYCKQYNLAVSGTKSNLIERLRPFLSSIDSGAALSGPSAAILSGLVNGMTEPGQEDSLQKRIAELQLQLKRSQEELEQFRSLCNNPFVGPEQPMVVGQATHGPPPAPPMATVMVASPYSLPPDDGPGGVEPVEKAPDPVPADSGPVPALEGSFFLGGLSAPDSTTVEYGRDLQEILHPDLGGPLPVDHSPTHRPTLDKVLGQVQPTISGLTMNADAAEDRNRMSAGSFVGAGVGPAVGDLQDLSLSMKSVNFDSVHGGGDASMQQDTIMLNDFEDIDLVDFHMHSLDSDGPFPMITNHDPDPSGAANGTHDGMGMFCNRTTGEKGLSNGMVDVQQHQPPQQHQPAPQQHMLHHQPTQQHSYLNNNDLSAVLRLDMMDHTDRADSFPAPKPSPFGSLHHSHTQHHLQHDQRQPHHRSDSNNNTSSQPDRLRFTVQQQPVASSSTSSSTSSTSSSPSSCFKGLRPAVASKPPDKAPQHHHLSLHAAPQTHQHHHHPLATADSAGGTALDAFQDNAMDFESLLTNDADGVLNANNCHRMMLDCAQDKPMFSYPSDPSILDFFTDDCNGHEYEIKHLDY